MPRTLPVTALLLLCASAGAAQLTTLASVDSGAIQGNAASGNPALTPDGRCVAFDSRASNLVAGDSNGKSDVFVHDRSSGETTRASIHSSGAESNDDSYKPSLSADCRHVAFSSYATNLVSGASTGTSQIYLHDRQTGQTRLISHDMAGLPGNGDSYIPTLSADGRLIAYYSYASNLVAGDSNNAADIFVFDLATATTTLVSRNAGGQPGNGDSYMPVISADGRSIAYESWADNLVADDSNGLLDIFLYDRLSGQTTLASRNPDGVPANGLSQLPALSADGRWLAYASEASDLVMGDGNGVSDIFLHDRSTATTLRISHSSTGQEGDASSFWPALSADGSVVAYQSFARNLVSADGNAQPDIFLHERASQRTLRVSVNASGNQGDGASETPTLSADGRLVAFSSLAANLAEQDSNGSSDVLLASALGANWTPIPQAGWWWNPAAPGQGFFIETRGPNLYLATLLYAQDGRALWYVTGGAMADAYHFAGEIRAYSGGQTLIGPYQPPAQGASPGTLALSFDDESHAQLNWPGGTIPLQRFPIPASNGAPPPPQPEAGWWWNPAEAGRGFTIEVQGDALYLAGLIYDASGAPLWIASTGTLSGNLYQGEWLQYAGGQTLDGVWTPPQIVPALPVNVTVQFFDARHATLTLPDGRTIPLQRFAF